MQQTRRTVLRALDVWTRPQVGAKSLANVPNQRRHGGQRGCSRNPHSRADPSPVLLPAETNPEERGDWQQPDGPLDDHAETREFAAQSHAPRSIQGHWRNAMPRGEPHTSTRRKPDPCERLSGLRPRAMRVPRVVGSLRLEALGPEQGAPPGLALMFNGHARARRPAAQSFVSRTAAGFRIK